MTTQTRSREKKGITPRSQATAACCLLVLEGSSPLLRSQISSAVSSLERDQKTTQPSRQDLFSSLRRSLSTIFSILGTTLPESKFHRAPTREVHSPPPSFSSPLFPNAFQSKQQRAKGVVSFLFCEPCQTHIGIIQDTGRQQQT